jgi:hypothetical protein
MEMRTDENEMKTREVVVVVEMVGEAEVKRASQGGGWSSVR